MADPVVTDPMTVTVKKKRSPREKFEIPDGWIARGFEFEVAWPDDPELASRVRSQFGGRRFAYNWALAQVKSDMDARKTDPSHASVQWNLYALRKRFNAEKPMMAATKSTPSATSTPRIQPPGMRPSRRTRVLVGLRSAKAHPPPALGDDVGGGVY